MELEIFKIKDELDGYLQNPNMIAWATALTFHISLNLKITNEPGIALCSDYFLQMETVARAKRITFNPDLHSNFNFQSIYKLEFDILTSIFKY